MAWTGSKVHTLLQKMPKIRPSAMPKTHPVYTSTRTLADAERGSSGLR